MKNMLRATRWNKVQARPEVWAWNAGNGGAFRYSAAVNMTEWFLSDKNPYRNLKHATLIGHSHGGNVAKMVKNNLEQQGWVVDLIEIATPQTDEYQTDVTGTGVYLNFYSSSDPVQYLGALSQGTQGPRIDPNAQVNLNMNTEPAYNGAPTLGHSIHQSEAAQAIIVNKTERAYAKKVPKGKDKNKKKEDNNYHGEGAHLKRNTNRKSVK